MLFYAIIDHFMCKNTLKVLLTLISGEKKVLSFVKKIILSFNWVRLLYVTIHYRWKTIQTGCCHSLKGDHDNLIEVTSKKRWKLQRLRRKNWDFDNWPLNTGRPLNMLLLNLGSTVSWIQQQWQLFVTYWKKTYIALWHRLLLSFPVSLHCLQCKHILLHRSCYYWWCSTVWCRTNESQIFPILS